MDKRYTRFKKPYRAVKTGKNNLIVTLPREWCELNDIHAGDSLNLFMDGNILVVQHE
jgi:hypothetical protein